MKVKFAGLPRIEKKSIITSDQSMISFVISLLFVSEILFLLISSLVGAKSRFTCIMLFILLGL
jgi:hypothetical protein